MTSSMTTYKCRAECSADINRVMRAFNQLNYFECGWETIKMEKLYLKGCGIDGADVFCGEMEWTFSIYGELTDLIEFIAGLGDTHVMVDTLELEADYTGIRKYLKKK